MVDINSGGRTVFKNAAQTQRRGVELAVQQQLGLSWQLGYSLTRLDATTPMTGLQLPGVAAQQQQVQLQYEQGNGWYANLTYRQLSRVAADDLNQLFAPAYHLTDFDAGWNGNTGTVNWHVYLAGQNLTNQAYISAVVVNQATGRSLEPGTPRQLSAGLHLKFQLL